MKLAAAILLFSLSASAQTLKTGDCVDWLSTVGTDGNAAVDTSLCRVAPGVVKVTDAAGNPGSIITPGLDNLVTSQFDKAASTVIASVPGLDLPKPLQAGRRYYFRAVIFCNASSGGGSKWTVSGTATATGIIYQVVITNAAPTLLVSARQTAMAATTSSTPAAASTTLYVTIEGSIKVNAGGSFGIGFAQQTASGTSSVLPGSLIYAREE